MRISRLLGIFLVCLGCFSGELEPAETDSEGGAGGVAPEPKLGGPPVDSGNSGDLCGTYSLGVKDGIEIPIMCDPMPYIEKGRPPEAEMPLLMNERILVSGDPT